MTYHMIDGGEQAFNALIYRPPAQHVLDHINTTMHNVRDMLGNAGQRFVDTAMTIYDKFNNSAVINAAKMFAYGRGEHMAEDQIYPLNYDNMHTANFIMQQYIIANPEVNKLVNNNMCYGFQNTYYNSEPGVVGKDRNDYRAVMDGQLVFTEEDSYYNTYSGSDMPELSHFDKYAVLDTWDDITYMIAKGIDPTSPDRDDL